MRRQETSVGVLTFSSRLATKKNFPVCSKIQKILLRYLSNISREGQSTISVQTGWQIDRDKTWRKELGNTDGQKNWYRSAMNGPENQSGPNFTAHPGFITQKDGSILGYIKNHMASTLRGVFICLYSTLMRSDLKYKSSPSVSSTRKTWNC